MHGTWTTGAALGARVGTKKESGTDQMVGPACLFQFQIDLAQRFFVAYIAGEDDVGEVGCHDAGHTGATVTIIFLIVILLNYIRKTEKRRFCHQAYACMPPR